MTGFGKQNYITQEKKHFFVYKFMKINLASGQRLQVTVHSYPRTS